MNTAERVANLKMEILSREIVALKSRIASVASRQKKAVTVPPTFSLLDASNLYLGRVGENVMKLAVRDGRSKPEMMYSVSSEGPSIVIQSGDDRLIITLNWTTRRLETAFTTPEDPEISSGMPINRIQGMPAPRVANAIWNWVL